MKVDKHISELLYEHNCVIVPNLGGFVANYTPAKIHPTQHTFTPPSKNIVFNKNLIVNDGLLANHIVSISKTSYPEAINTIGHFVSSAKIQLKKGEKVRIESLGTLYLDVERNIQFTPSATNYLLDAFGLTEFQSPAIKRDNIAKRIEKEFKDRDAIPSEKRKVNVKRIAAVAILIPFIFGMIWIPLKTDLLKHVNYSNLNPFASKETTKVVVVTKKAIHKLKVKTTPKVSLPISNDTINTPINSVTTTAQPVTASIEETKTTENVKPDATRVAVNNNSLETGDLKFHLVTGCFQIEENAINFVASLNQQNIPASIIGKRNGLFVVSCGDYSTRKDALDNLNLLKVNQPNAWLLKN